MGKEVWEACRGSHSRRGFTTIAVVTLNNACFQPICYFDWSEKKVFLTQWLQILRLWWSEITIIKTLIAIITQEPHNQLSDLSCKDLTGSPLRIFTNNILWKGVRTIIINHWLFFAHTLKQFVSARTQVFLPTSTLPVFPAPWHGCL